MNRSLSIPEWHRMALEGTAPQVRILLNGGSMFPLVRWNRDYVTVAPQKGMPAVGDIVLFYERGKDRYVVHRVWEVRDGTVLTWGDNCASADGWISPEEVWGKIILIERGKRTIQPDPAKGMRWARFWHQAGKGYRLGRRIKEAVIRRLRIRKR